MYRAKSNGRNILCFFEPAMQKALEEHATLESWMRTALREHEFRLYYQVQVDHNRQPIGAEALIRWKHPIQGFIYTPDFINVAEESELIVAIGQWVLETGCAQIKAWESNPAMRSLSLSINVSARQFGRPDFVETIKAVIARSAIASEKLKLEMTEGLLIHDVDDTVAKMTQLKSIGVQFSMDDFGTGHSSLNYLKRLPLSQLKIDQSFVRDITVDANDAAIVKTIIRMGQTLQMNVIAEGVETEEQLRFLKENGCTVFQGYLFGKPLPLEEFERLIASCNERRLVDRKSNAPG
jgi:EAL domain-containing protein (putative c-di-GMP-specific phosphodiesterase class I)